MAVTTRTIDTMTLPVLDAAKTGRTVIARYDPNTRSFWPPGEHSRARPSPYSRYGTPESSYGEATYAGRVMDGDAASFFPGQRSHYYQGMRGEWEDDDFERWV
jgi:hypothetical protein